MAKQMEPVLQKQALSVLHQWWKEAITRARAGKVPVPPDAKQRWPASFRSAIRPVSLQIAGGAWDLAGEELGAGQKGMPGGTSAIRVKQVEVGDQDSFLLQGDVQNIDKYLQDTSKSVAKRHSDFLDQLFNKAQSYVDPDTGAGMTPADIAKYLTDLGGPFTESYSRMIARTTTSWSANEGAKQRYDQAGVTMLEWFTTEDDVTCEFCAALDGKQIPITGTFAGPGFPVGGIEPDKYFNENASVATGESMDLPFGIEHPPLHPNCRCTLLPVMDSIELAPEVEMVEKPEPIVGGEVPEKVPQEVGVEEKIAKELESFATKYADANIEHFWAIGEDGARVLSKGGSEHAVSFVVGDMRKMTEQKIMTHIHNHPSSVSFSPDDVRLHLRIRAKEMRVVSSQYEYKLVTDIPIAETEIPKVYKEYRRIEKKMFKELTPQVLDGRLTIDQANMMHAHGIMTQLAEKRGWIYERIAR